MICPGYSYSRDSLGRGTIFCEKGSQDLPDRGFVSTSFFCAITKGGNKASKWPYDRHFTHECLCGQLGDTKADKGRTYHGQVRFSSRPCLRVILKKD